MVHPDSILLAFPAGITAPTEPMGNTHEAAEPSGLVNPVIVSVPVRAVLI